MCAAVALCAACEDDDRPIIPLPPLDPPASAGDKVIALVEQNPSRVALVDRASGEMLWSWTPADSDLTAAEQAWFELPDEVKPIYDCEYLLVTATRGGVAIIRIEDKRVMFYACPKGQPHSAELLPDGNVVVASSTDGTADGDKLRLYEVDFTKRFASEPAAVYPLNFGHNAVWDRTNELLWATAGDVLHAYRYIRTDGRPALALQETYPLPDGQKDAHDLFPVYGLAHYAQCDLEIQCLHQGVRPFQCQRDGQRQVRVVGPGRLRDDLALSDAKLLVGQADRHWRPQRLPARRRSDLQGPLDACQYVQLSRKSPTRNLTDL